MDATNTATECERFIGILRSEEASVLLRASETLPPKKKGSNPSAESPRRDSAPRKGKEPLLRGIGRASGWSLRRDVAVLRSKRGLSPFQALALWADHCGATSRFLMSHWPLTRTSWSTPRPAAATRTGV